MPRVRLTEVLAALSLTTDLATGLPVEKGLRTCLVATGLARACGADEQERAAVFTAALLRSVGCTAHASENAALFGDDRAFEAAFADLDTGDPEVLGRQLAAFGSWDPGRRPELVRRFVAAAPTEGPRASRAACEVSRALGGRLGAGPDVLDALDDVYERWDGRGLPGRHRGDEVSRVARTVHTAEQAVLAAARGGVPGARSEVLRRAGGHLDPDIAAVFVREAEELFAVLDEPDLLAAVLRAEPAPVAAAGQVELADVGPALAAVVDLKGRHLLGHSAHVADLAEAAGRASACPPEDRAGLRAAGLLHDLGRVTVSSEVWDRPGRLGVADVERVRLHSYWTDRVLRRCSGLAALADAAAGHHERCDGSGYHRGVRAGELPFPARLLAAADVLAALTEPRPHRAALGRDAAAQVLGREAATGALDADACDAVLAGADLPRPRRSWPCGLTEREVEVLRLAARGLPNRGIAGLLGVSERTVAHHLAHVFDKTGRRTRAGAAVFAMEHGLAVASPGWDGWAERPMPTAGARGTVAAVRSPRSRRPP